MHVDPTVYVAAKERFTQLEEQGHTITLMDPATQPDMILAPHAYRLTPDMVLQMPVQSLELVIKSVRDLKYNSKHEGETEWKTGKAKHGVQNKKARKGKNTAKQAEAADGAEPAVEAGSGSVTQ